MSARPARGGSIGSGIYSSSPSTLPHSQLWLAHALSIQSKIHDCLVSVRADCNVIESPAERPDGSNASHHPSGRGDGDLYQDRGFGGAGRQHRASQSCDHFVRQTFRFCDRESSALLLKCYPSHVVCVILIKRSSGSGQSKFFNARLDKGSVMQLFTLSSWPGKFQALDGRQNENPSDSRSV